METKVELTEEQMNELIKDESNLSVKDLERKYGQHDWGHHPVFLRERWRSEVANDNTISGYWSWVANSIGQAMDDLDDDDGRE
jgi:hypothetical protein